MEKLLCVVLFSCILVVTLVDTSSSLNSSPSSIQAKALGRKGRELHLLGHMHEGKRKKQPEVVDTEEVKKPEEMKAGWTDQNEDAEKGLIYSADYSGVSMHSHSPPMHKHPQP